MGAPDHTAPTADFSGSCYPWFYLCSLDASGSSAGDAPIVSYGWNFGDGTTGTGRTTWHF
nr:PKD domain-containing protein [Nocardiopsis sp. CNR-923]